MNYLFYPGCTWSSAAGYRESAIAVNQALGITITDIHDWNCCGATVAFSVGEDDALFLGARVLALVRDQGAGHLVTGCNACYTTLRKVRKRLIESPDSLEAVNRRLAAEGLTADTEVAVRHHIEILVNDIPESRWQSRVRGDFVDVRVAPYYGCQLTRPWNDMEPPDILERLIRLSGFTPVDHSASRSCCGAALAVPHAAETRPLIGRITRAMSMKNAQLMTTVCPLCQLNMDQGQTGRSRIPVTYYTQVAGLGLGIPPKDLGIDKLLIPLNVDRLRHHGN